MTTREPDGLLRSFQGPQPRPETTRAILDAARAAAASASEVSSAEPKQRKAGRPTRADRHRPLRWIAAGLAAAAAIVLAALTVPFGGKLDVRPDDGKAGVAATGGLAATRMSRSGASEQLALDIGAPLYAGDDLAASARADIFLADRSTLRVDRGVRLTIESASFAAQGDARSQSPPSPGGAAVRGEVRLVLKAGRVFLRVPPGGPFVVAASAEVRVAGTAFGLEESAGRTSVSVIDGSVSLASAGQSVELSRGQSGEARRDGPPSRTLADPDRSVLWARDPTRFEEQPLADVLDWITRNSSYRFTVVPESLRQTRVSLAVMDEPMQQVVEALSLACGLNVSFNGFDVTITKKEYPQ